MWWVVIIVGIVFIGLWVTRPGKNPQFNLFDTYSYYLSKYQDINKKKKREED